MKIFVIGLLLVSHCCGDSPDGCTDADECSMLQVEVQESSKQGVSASFQTIRESLDALRSSDQLDLNRIAIHALMNSVDEATPLSAADKATLNNVSNLFQGVLDTLKSQRNNAQNTIDGHNASIQACRTNEYANFSTKKTTWENDLGTHRSCRMTESSLHTAMTTNCQNVTVFITTRSGTSNPNCIDQTAASLADDFPFDFSTEVNNVATDAREMASQKASYDADEALCRPHWDAWYAMRGNCSAKQLTAETSYCSYWNADQDQCERRTNCTNDAIGLYDTHYGTASTVSTLRVKECALIGLAKCLVDTVVQNPPPVGDLSSALAGCHQQNLTAYEEECGNVELAHGGPHTCPAPMAYPTINENTLLSEFGLRHYFDLYFDARPDVHVTTCTRV